jgi:hypothetical protein
MPILTLLILLTTTTTFPVPRHISTAGFPTKTKDWELTDAIAELRDPQSTPIERQVARMRLEELGAPSLPALRRVAAQDMSREVRALAQSAIACINGFPVAPEARPEPGRGAFSLSNIAAVPGVAMAELQALFEDAKYGLLEEALHRNIDLLERGGPGDREDAANRLACIRPFAAAALPALVRSLSHPDASVRDAAANAICAEGASPPVERLIAMLDDPDAALRLGAMRGLLRLAPHDPRFTEVMHPARTRESLLANLRSPSPERRIEAAAYLSGNHIIPPTVAAALLRAVQSGDFVAREGLVLGIERAWADGGEVEAVLKTIQDDDPDHTNRAYASAARRAITSLKPD